MTPFLVFTVFYLNGRRLDLKAKLGSFIRLVFAGLYVGKFLGYRVTYSVTTYIEDILSPSLSHILFYSLYPITIIAPFFVALSASAVAYIRNTKRGVKSA